jgi:hypothetical protein
VLSEADKQLYARQILLRELGLAGQEQLCMTDIVLAGEADPRCRAIAGEYLERAGVRVEDAAPGSALGAARVLRLPASEDVARLAGDPTLEGCAAWLLGSLAAVDAIKQVLGAGNQDPCTPAFVLAAEVR